MRHKEIINQATIRNKQRSNQVSLFFNTEMFKAGEEVRLQYFEDGVQIIRASIASHKKNTLKLAPKGENSFLLTLCKPYVIGVYDIEQIDGDTIFVPCLMVE